MYKQGTPVWQADKTHPVPLGIPRCISAIEDSLVFSKLTGKPVELFRINKISRKFVHQNLDNRKKFVIKIWSYSKTKEICGIFVKHEN